MQTSLQLGYLTVMLYILSNTVCNKTIGMSFKHRKMSSDQLQIFHRIINTYQNNGRQWEKHIKLKSLNLFNRILLGADLIIDCNR